jgi:hypothetical protein
MDPAFDLKTRLHSGPTFRRAGEVLVSNSEVLRQV